MNRNFPRYLLASSIAVWATHSTAANDPVGACETRLLSGVTAYPDAPARARRGGKVLMALTVAPNGKVAHASVRSSSGSRTLDAAALNGALNQWQFTPSSCGAFVATEVAIEFEPRIASLFSASRASAYRQKLVTAAERGCEVSKDGAKDSVITCIVGAPGRTRLAQR